MAADMLALLSTSMQPQDELDAVQRSFVTNMMELARQGKEDNLRQDQNEEILSLPDDNELSWDNVITRDSESAIPWYIIVVICVLAVMVLYLFCSRRSAAEKFAANEFHTMADNGTGFMQSTSNSKDVVLGRPTGRTDQNFPDNVHAGTTVVLFIRFCS